MFWMDEMGGEDGGRGVKFLDGEEQVMARKKAVELNLRISQGLSYHMMKELISKVLHPLSVSKLFGTCL